MYFGISKPWHMLGTGMNKTSQRRVTPLLPPQEQETNGALNLSLVTIHFSFWREQEEAGTVPIPVFHVHPFTCHLVSGSSLSRYLLFNALTTFTNGEL
jgi:hypothetical protein